jgi:hypothetical protein
MKLEITRNRETTSHSVVSGGVCFDILVSSCKKGDPYSAMLMS